MIELNVSTLSGGALVERIQDEISKTIANITDPNTPAKKARTVTMKMTIKPNEQRNMAEVSVSTSSTLCAPTPIETDIYIGMNPKTGEIGASEMTSGEDPMQHVLPDVESAIPGRITRFPDGKTASAGN